MRTWDEKGEVHPKRWENFKDILPYADVVVFSEEDISDFGEGIIRDYIPIAKIVILTRGEKGSTLFFGGESYNISAFPTNEVEPTGAGDVFGSAFLVKYNETGDPIKAAQFASVTASFVVEKEGTEGIPILEQVLARENLYYKLDA
ncbi:Ribokinase [subsurface metagenome]